MTLAVTSPQTQHTSFSLLTKPWIPVVFNQSLEYKEISLQDLFLHWDELKTVQAANPPRTIAMWRWLIAFTQWSIQGPATVNDWAELWKNQELGRQIIERLETVSHRFDLLHPKYPFGQCPDVLHEATEKNLSPAAKLLLQDNDTGLLWTHYSQWKPASLSYAEASQELLRLLCCDLGGTKSDSDKKNRSARPGFCVMRRTVIPTGKTIKETVLLNLYQYDPSNDIPSRFTSTDLPLWERDTIQRKSRSICGLLDYLTFPSRRILLTNNSSEITGIYIYNGEQSTDRVEYVWELWQAFQDGQSLQLDVNKASWRDAEALLHPTTETSKKPRIFEWLMDCQETTNLVPNPLQVQVMGFAHEDKKQGKPWQWIHDTMTISQIYLDSEEAYYALVRGLKYAEEVGKLFSSKTYAPVADALKLSKPKGKKDNDWTRFIRNISSISSSYWSALDAEFERFMSDLVKDEEIDEEDGDITYGLKAIPEWKEKLKEIATDFYEQSLSGVSSYEARARGLNVWHKELRKVLEKK